MSDILAQPANVTSFMLTFNDETREKRGCLTLHEAGKAKTQIAKRKGEGRIQRIPHTPLIFEVIKSHKQKTHPTLRINVSPHSCGLYMYRLYVRMYVCMRVCVRVSTYANACTRYNQNYRVRCVLCTVYCVERGCGDAAARSPHRWPPASRSLSSRASCTIARGWHGESNPRPTASAAALRKYSWYICGSLARRVARKVPE